MFVVAACLILFEGTLFELVYGGSVSPPGLVPSQPSQLDSPLASTVRKLLGKAFRLGTLTYVVTLLLISTRVLLESGIVLFNIAESVEQIRAWLLKEEGA